MGAIFLTASARALDVGPLSESHKARIAANCTSAKTSLQQLHRSDASLRVNRGQLYESISTKLMARLNSRLALNRLDGSELVAAAARYERSFTQFRTNYQAYEEQLSALLRINCKKQPEDFYSIETFSGSAVTVTVNGKVQPSDQWRVTAEMRRQLLEEFEKHKIPLA